MIAIHYTETALALREAINIALAVFTFVLFGLFAWFSAERIWTIGYRNTDWTVKSAIGLLFVFLGELLRSSTIAFILHTEGSSGNYLSDIYVLMAALVCIILGCLCVIRVMSPKSWGNVLWISSLLVVIVAYALNWAV